MTWTECMVYDETSLCSVLSIPWTGIMTRCQLFMNGGSSLSWPGWRPKNGYFSHFWDLMIQAGRVQPLA